MHDIKSQFPIFQNNPGLVYLDNAATTQKPEVVLNVLTDFYTKMNANVHRGLYPLSENATELYELARRKVAKFINADPEEIIFVSGTTDGINSIANSLVKSGMLSSQPKILATELEHHANILPWQGIENAQMHYIPMNENFELDMTAVDNLGQVDVLAISHISNVTGTLLPVKEIIARCSQKYSVVDAAQSIAHMPIDVKDMNCDFLVFSGHKAYGPTGIGVIYAKKEYLENMSPFRVGGGMIREVHRDSATWAELPQRFEAGTPAIAETVSLAAALEFICELDLEQIQAYESEHADYLADGLQSIPGLKLYHPREITQHGGVFSFSIEGIHPHDLAQALGEEKICVRAGHHCTQILHREILKIPASTRVSLAIYNDKTDIDKLIIGLDKAIKIYN
jgi:cysteine desulfurase / selenocysteine lyase